MGVHKNAMTIYFYIFLKNPFSPVVADADIDFLVSTRGCCFASACLAEQARSPLRAINCLVPWGTETIPRMRCPRPNGSEQNDRWGRFCPTLFGVGVHPPRRSAILLEVIVVAGVR